ncbi:MAG: XdhC family protein [Anaerolineae bacterium]|nr:XdhC family protein [Anaerolineae bacterium]
MEDTRPIFEAVAAAQARGEAVALATIIAAHGSAPRHTGSKLLLRADGTTLGTVGGGLLEARVVAVAREALRDGQPRTETYVLNDIGRGDPGVCGGTVTVFIEPITAPPTLVIIGGGHVGKALAELAKWMEFRVVLTDDRPEYCSPEYAAGMDEYIVCAPAELPKRLNIQPETVIAAVTRGLPVDLHLIPALLATPAAYIGLIGSRRRWALTVKALADEHGVTREQLARIHAPIGLELEAETPKEIAISIMAEIIMVRHGGTGQPMRWLGEADEAQGAAGA